MDYNLAGIVFVLLGCFALILKEKRQEFVRSSLQFQNKNYGLDFSDRIINIYVRLSFYFCILVIAIGIIIFLGLDDDLGITTKK